MKSVKYILARSMMLPQTSHDWEQQWLSQWFIAGTPMTARAHAAHYGMRLLPQKVG
jgi:hypothetical protein